MRIRGTLFKVVIEPRNQVAEFKSIFSHIHVYTKDIGLDPGTSFGARKWDLLLIFGKKQLL